MSSLSPHCKKQSQQPIGSAVSLSAEQVEFFRSEGYLTLNSFIEMDEVCRLRALLSRLFAEKSGLNAGDYLDLSGTDEDHAQVLLPQILLPVKYAPELTWNRFHLLANELASQLFGPGVVPEGEHAIMKPALVGAPTPLHQDEAFWGESTRYESLSVWLALQDVSDLNGCMEFVPGSHLRGVLPHHSVNGDMRNNGLEVDDAATYRRISCPLKAGGVTIHHCRTLHGAGANHGTTDRLAYILGFGLPPQLADSPRDFYWLKEKMLLRQRRAEEEGRELTKMRREL